MVKCPFCGEVLDMEREAATAGRIECATCHALVDPDWVVDGDELPGGSSEEAPASPVPPAAPPPAEPAPVPDDSAVQIDDFVVEPPAPEAALPSKPRSPGGGTGTTGSYSLRAGQLIQAEEVVLDAARARTAAGERGDQAGPDISVLDVDERVEVPASARPHDADSLHTGRGGRDAPYSSRNLLSDEVDLADPLAAPGRRLHPLYSDADRRPPASGGLDLDAPGAEDALDLSFDGLGDLGSDSPFDIGAPRRSGPSDSRGPNFDDVLRPEGVGGTDDVFGGFHASAAPEDEFDIPLPPGWDDPGLGSRIPDIATLPPEASEGFGEGLFLGTDRLDIDVPLGGDAPAGAAPLPAVAAGLKAPKPRKVRKLKGGGLPVGRIALLGLLLVGLVGAILGQTRYGYFGARLFLGKEGRVGAHRGGARAGDAASLAKDLRDAYEYEVRRLDRVLKDDPNQPAVQAELYELLLRYRERFPLAVASDPGVSTRLRELQARVRLSGRSDELARAMQHAFDGRYDEARGVLDGMLAAGARDAELMYHLGRVAFQRQDWAQAKQHFEAALALDPLAQASRYFLVRTLIAMKDWKAARPPLAALMAASPEHLGGQVSLAEIELAERNLDGAVAQAAGVVNRAKAGADAQEQFLAYSVLARVEEARGNLEGRMSQLRAALAAQPSDERTAWTLGKLLLAGGKRGEALGALRPCRERGCNSEEFLLTFAQAAFADEQAELADQAIAEGVGLYPNSARFAILKGNQELNLGRIEAATMAFQQAIKVDPQSVEGYRQLAKARIKGGRLSEAGEVLQRGLEAVPDSVELLLDLADVQNDQRDLAGAERTLRDAIRLDGKNVKAQRILGRVLEQQGRFEDAVQVLAVLEAGGALDRDGTLCLGRAYLAVKKPQAARDLLKRLHLAAPTDPEASSEYGRALMEAGDPKAAEIVLDEVVRDHPQQSLAHFYRGRLLAQQGRGREAVEAFQESSRLKPRDANIRVALARALLALGNRDSLREARTQLDTVIVSYSRDEVPAELWDPDAWALRGRLLFEEDKYPQALKDFEAALALAPGNLELMLRCGETLFEMARFDDALPHLRRVLAKEPRHPDAHYYLGKISVRRGDVKGAMKHLELAVERDPARHPDAHRMLGMIYRDERMNGPARKAFERFLEYRSEGPEAEEVRQLLARMRP